MPGERRGGHVFTLEQQRKGGRRGGLNSARMRRRRAMQRVIEKILDLYEDRLQPLSDTERVRAVRLMAMAWRRGYDLGQQSARERLTRLGKVAA